jgi:hypothetical protein
MKLKILSEISNRNGVSMKWRRKRNGGRKRSYLGVKAWAMA